MAFRPFQDPQQIFGTLQDEMNRVFERVWHGGISTRPFDGQPWAPAIDLYEHDDRYVLYVEVPGVDGSTVDVSCVGNTLTLRGDKRRPAGVTDETPAIHGERRFGNFCRTIDLPAKINVDQVSACCHGGVLEITVPKSESSRPKSVRVSIDEG
jgi:HSP20 family protein